MASTDTTTRTPACCVARPGHVGSHVPSLEGAPVDTYGNALFDLIDFDGRRSFGPMTAERAASCKRTRDSHWTNPGVDTQIVPAILPIITPGSDSAGRPLWRITRPGSPARRIASADGRAMLVHGRAVKG